MRRSDLLAFCIVSPFVVALSGCGGSSGGIMVFTGKVAYNEPVKITIQVLMKGFSTDKRLVGVPVLNGPLQNGGYYFASPSATIQSLTPTGDGLGNDVPLSVNKMGQIVGFETPNQTTSALYWSSPTATPTVLAIPATGAYAYPESINDNGEIVGYLVTGGVAKACYWKSPTATAVALPGSPQGVSTVGISNKSQISAVTPTGSYVWTAPTSPPIALPATKGTGTSFALAISNYGVAGYVGTSSTVNTNAVWSSSGLAEYPVSGSGSTTSLTTLNESGELGGTMSGAVVWPNPTSNPELINSNIPTAEAAGVLYSVFCIFDDGTMVTTGTDPASGNPVYDYVTPKG